jgi:hypothetical protein
MEKIAQLRIRPFGNAALALILYAIVRPGSSALVNLPPTLLKSHFVR